MNKKTCFPAADQPRKGEHSLLSAGLLTFGSTESLSLPIISDSDCEAFVPNYSGGSAPDFHGIPYSPATQMAGTEGLLQRVHPNKKQCFMQI